MIEGRDLNDTDILQSTEQVVEEGKVRYRTKLPSGREVTSEWMNPDDMAGKIVIKWCEFIREQVDLDAREAAAVKKRKPIEEEVEKEVKEEQAEDATNPVEFAKHQRDLYQERVNVLEERITAAKIERKKCRDHLEQWEKIVGSLRGETDE